MRKRLGPSYFRVFLKDDFTDETHFTYIVKRDNWKTFMTMYMNKAVIFSTASKKYVKSYNLTTKKLIFTDNIHAAMLFKDFTYARKSMVDIYNNIEKQSDNCKKKNIGYSFDTKFLVVCIILN